MLPIDFPLPEGVLLYGSAFYARILTLDALEAFWRQHREQYPFCVQGSVWTYPPEYLATETEWVFASSKASLMKAVLRWDQMGMRCEVFDWATYDPEDYAQVVLECAESGETVVPAQWVLKNLHGGDEWCNHDALIPPSVPLEEATVTLLEQLFDSSDGMNEENQLGGQVTAYDRAAMDEFIANSRKDEEQYKGDGYYGCDEPEPSQA